MSLTNHKPQKRKKQAIGEQLLLTILLLSASLAIASITASSAVVQAAAQSKSITATLSYGNSPGFDDNNDGVESNQSAIDFSISPSSTSFSWDVNQSNLCTLWRVIPLQKNTATLACYGASHCCKFADLTSAGSDWNETFYLYTGIYDVTDTAIVSAKVVYTDYKLSGQESYSDVAYSNWTTLTALFTSTSPSPSAFPNGIFASIAIADAAQITVLAPDNSSALASGENLALRITVNSNVSVLYSLDNAANVTMSGNRTSAASNFTSQLSGTLPGEVLANGTHIIAIYAIANSTNTTAALEHRIAVADTYPPSINISPAINNTAIASASQSYAINATSDEYANISYRLNSGTNSSAANVTHSANISLSPNSGTNNLTITATDMQGNSHAYFYSFNFTLNSTGTCSDAVQNYHDSANETGIDCGGPCSACVTFAVTTDKENYTLGELVYISIQARSDARHNITITGPSYATSFAYNGSTYYIVSPPNVGQYKMNVSMAYRNLSPDYIVKYFQVNSSTSAPSLTASISANATTINKDETVEFKSQASGNVSAVSYKWDLNGDNVIDSTSPSVNYTFTAPGTYYANLNVSDVNRTKTATETITVRPYYNITLSVKPSNNGTGTPSALVTVSGAAKTASPSADYQLLYGTYPVRISTTGYKDIILPITVTRNETFSFAIYLNDSRPPQVVLLNPPNNVNATGSNITIRFRVEDETTNTCKAYTRKENESWVEKSSIAVADSTQKEMNIPGLENSAYQWRVECTDEEKHTNSSETRAFNVQERFVYSAALQEAKVENLTELLNSVIEKTRAYAKLEKEAAETLHLVDTLEKAKVELARPIRDMREVKWRRFNASDEEAFIKQKTNEIDLAAGNITTDIAVLKSSKFVSYPTDNDIREAASAYLQSLQKSLAKDELKRYISENSKVQQTAVITSDYKIVELTKINGDKKAITLVEKTLDFTGDMRNLLMVETIPKDLASTVKQVNFLFDYDVIKQDPVVAVQMKGGKKYAYYLENELSLSQIQKATSTLLNADVKAQGKKATGPTGLLVLKTAVSGKGALLAAEILVVLLLGALYYGHGKAALRSLGKNKQLGQLEELISRLNTMLQQNNHLESKKLYTEAREAFKLLKPKERKAVYDALTELRHKIDAHYIKALIKETLALLNQGRHEKAERTYATIGGLYRSLPPKYRKEVYEACAELHEKLGKAEDAGAAGNSI